MLFGREQADHPAASSPAAQSAPIPPPVDDALDKARGLSLELDSRGTATGPRWARPDLAGLGWRFSQESLRNRRSSDTGL